MKIHSLALPLLLIAHAAYGSTGGSRIEQVTLYANSAEITRVTAVPMGTSFVTFECVPMTFVQDSVRAQGGVGVRTGDVRIEAMSPSSEDACRHSPERDRVRALEDIVNRISVEQDANRVVSDYVKAHVALSTKGAEADARSVAAYSTALRDTMQAAELQGIVLGRKLEAAELELKNAVYERDRLNGISVHFMSIRVATEAQASGEAHITYQSAHAGWGAAYRASLETASGVLNLERSALIAQNTGEPWTGVNMVLATGQPTRSNLDGPHPASILLDYIPPPPSPTALVIKNGLLERLQVTGSNLRRADTETPSPVQVIQLGPDPLPAAQISARAATPASDAPLFDANEFNGTFATLFTLPSPVTLPSDGQKASVFLGTRSLNTDLIIRTVPGASDASGYLIAQTAHMEGVWPRGYLQVVRDGVAVGSIASWQPDLSAPFSLAFGRDELLAVNREPILNTAGRAGPSDTEMERKLHALYTITNRHTAPITIEVVESGPQSSTDKIKVTRTFTPQPTELNWNKTEGVIAWRQQLEAGQSAQFRADYQIRSPRDGSVRGM